MNGEASVGSLLALYFGIDSRFIPVLQEAMKSCPVEARPFDLEALMSIENPTIPSVVFCGHPPKNVSLDETAQTLRSIFPETPIFLIMDSTANADRNKMLKNGFNDVFFFPLDKTVFKEHIASIFQSLRAGEKKYRSVKLLDLQPNEELSFDTHVYLPMNNRYVRLSGAKSKITEAQISKLKSRNTGSLFVAEEDMSKFYDYAAESLRKTQGNAAMSATQKEEKLRDSVRVLVSGFFSDEGNSLENGKKVAEDCRKIVQQYVAGGKMGDLYAKLAAISSEAGDSYSHAMNVSAYVGLFAMALGMENVEDMALGGLLHDIGMAKVPMEIQEKNPNLWTAEERKVFESHPDYSIEMIKEKKIVVKESVLKMIAQHHERMDGSGFPKGPNAGKISMEAQVLALANEFDHMMTVKPGVAKMAPIDVLKHFQKMAAGDPNKAIIDIQALKKILSLFTEETSKGKESA